MNITKEILQGLKAIDLSTEAAVVESYEALAGSPAFVPFLLRSYLSEVKEAYAASGQEPEAIAGVFREKLREYATIGRSLNKRSTLKAIRRRIGLLFAEWEAEERRGGAKASDWHLYTYAADRGFNPEAAALSGADTAALDEVADFVFKTIEAYLLYSLRGAETDLHGLLPDKVGNMAQEAQKRLIEEAQRQISVLLAPEWESAGGGLVTSCEEEANFFGAEASEYAAGVIRFLVKDPRQAAELRSKLGTAPRSEAASTKQAQGKYKEYIKTNTIC